MSLLQLIDIGFKTQEKTILDGISFRVDYGDIIGVLGASGAGKTSLFRSINLLQSPTSGRILYQDKDTLLYPPTMLRRAIGYVFQKPYLFGTTIKENLIYPYQLLEQQPNFQEIAEYLTKANLPENIINKNNNELSGGEQQRIALIRSLLVKPTILLLDEVTASLDEENTLLIEKLIADQNKEQKVTILFISHNIGQIERLAQKVLSLAKGQVGFYGNKDEYFTQKGMEK